MKTIEEMVGEIAGNGVSVKVAPRKKYMYKLDILETDGSLVRNMCFSSLKQAYKWKEWNLSCDYKYFRQNFNKDTWSCVWNGKSYNCVMSVLDIVHT